MKYTGLGLTGAAIPVLASGCSETSSPGSKTFQTIYEKVCHTLFIDTHEHLVNESVRLEAGDRIGDKANDWTFLLSHYFNDDFVAAGVSPADYKRFYSTDLDALEKWDIIEPYWPYLKYTGYGQNVRITLKELYGIKDLTRENIPELNRAYKAMIQPGFYRRIIQEISGIESCQVNRWPYLKSEMPDLLMSDLHISHFMESYMDSEFPDEAGIQVRELEDWYGVIDFCFKKYGTRAVATKCGEAYSRNVNFKRIPFGKASDLFRQRMAGKSLSPSEENMIEDHLFWYCTDLATKMGLPSKIHLGYYAGTGRMPLERVGGNPGAACELCMESPDTKFVFFHIAWPYYEDILAVAKQFPNAYLDMCWAWIINPIAAKDFLKKFIVTVPLNKVFTFGGDYIPVELIPGHARIARRGIALALSELVDEGWLGMGEALSMCDDLMHGNARKAFNLDERGKFLKSIDWNEEMKEKDPSFP